MLFSAEDLGLENNTQEAIFGGNTVAEASKIFKKIIEGQGSEAQNNVVCANAGLAIATAKQLTHIEGYELAKEALYSGKANKCLTKLIKI